MDKKFIVTKSNNLITAKYNLSLEEQRIILMLAAVIKPEDEDFKIYRFKIKDFLNVLEVTDPKKYSVLKQVTKNLISKPLIIKTEKSELQATWLSTAEYFANEGVIELEFSPKLKPYLLKLKEFFTTYKLENILRLKSKYSIRMYELLKMNKYKKECTYSLDELKYILDVENDKAYQKYDNFKRKIIIMAQNELKAKTDICFEYEPIKEGRKITAIKFIINENNNNVNDDTTINNVEYTVSEPTDNETFNKIKTLFNDNISTKDTNLLIEISNNNFDIIKEKYDIAIKQGGIENLVAWVKKAIKEDYKEPIKVSKKNYFNNYSGQREYDIKALEELMLRKHELTEEEYEEYLNRVLKKAQG